MRTDVLRKAADQNAPRYAAALRWAADELDRRKLGPEVVQACYDMASWRHRLETGAGLTLRA